MYSSFLSVSAREEEAIGAARRETYLHNTCVAESSRGRLGFGIAGRGRGGGWRAVVEIGFALHTGSGELGGLLEALALGTDHA